MDQYDDRIFDERIDYCFEAANKSPEFRSGITLIIGCGSPAEIAANLHVGRTAEAMSDGERAALESRLARRASRYAYFKTS